MLRAYFLKAAGLSIWRGRFVFLWGYSTHNLSLTGQQDIKYDFTYINVCRCLFKWSQRKYWKCCWTPAPLLKSGTKVTDARTVCQARAKGSKTNISHFLSRNKTIPASRHADHVSDTLLLVTAAPMFMRVPLHLSHSFFLLFSNHSFNQYSICKQKPNFLNHFCFMKCIKIA